MMSERRRITHSYRDMWHSTTKLYHCTEAPKEEVKTHKTPKHSIQMVNSEHKRIYAQLPAMQHLPRSCLTIRSGAEDSEAKHKETKGGIKGGIKAISSIVA